MRIFASNLFEVYVMGERKARECILVSKSLGEDFSEGVSFVLVREMLPLSRSLAV